MKNHKIVILLLAVPMALFAQSGTVSSEAAKAPNVKAGVLSEQTEVLLDLPGQGDDTGEVSITDEETISVDFPDEDVRTILRSVADLYDLNLVIPDGLQGRTSVKLNNITWDQVFEVVLEPLGYTFIEDRNIIRVKSIEELTAEPVDTRIFIANYARAEELQASIESLVDPAAGGRVQVDVRSNALIVRERPSRMGRIESTIRILDQPTEQVMIESKFIEVSDTDVQNIGINWTSLDGYGVSAGPFQRSFTSSSGTDITTNENLIDNTTTPPTITTVSTTESSDFTTRLDTALFSADEFSIILSALRTKNDIKLVSNPTVVALNNTSAKIAIGERYPLPEYAFNAQTGERQLTGFEFIDIGINLDVKPSVNDAGFINLAIIPEVSAIGEVVQIEDTQIPRITSRRTEANVTIKDGHTLAIGGLSSEDTNNNVTKVPFLGDIPGIGRFFRSNSDSTISRNLVIFITAKTLDPDGSTYRDVVDPRVLNEMNVVPSDLPGYEISDEDAQIFKDMEDIRMELRRESEIDPTKAEVEAFKKAEQAEQLKEERKNKNKNKEEKQVEQEELSEPESAMEMLPEEQAETSEE